MRRVSQGLGVAAIGLISLQIGTMGVRAAQDEAAKPEFYTAKVKPILDANCGRCHEDGHSRGGLNMDTRANLLHGGNSGPAIVPGEPMSSLMVRLIRHEGPADDPMPMPPKKPKLSDEDIAVITQWVKAGAVMPAPPSAP